MYTLSFPIQIPPEHGFFADARSEVPKLMGYLEVSFEPPSGVCPHVIKVSGFPSMQAAREFAPRLARCIQWASLKFGHSMSPSLSEAVESQQKIYAGSLPTVFATALKAHDYHTSMTSKASRHISELVTCINDAFEQNVTSTVATGHPLSLALELHSNVGFSGGANAQFIALFSALEVLVPQKSKANRGDIVRLVKNTLSGIGRTDAKTVGKRVEALYIERNALVHEGKAISSSMVNELDQIVRDTLIALVSIAPATQATA